MRIWGVKKSVFSETEKWMREDALITSNTSSLSVEEMASALKNPERFAGLHFFNPVDRMPLVEIITHSKVSQETVEALYQWVLRVKKTPVVVKDGPGFLVNRILMPYLNEAMFLLEEGVPVEVIDEACLSFGMPMGPCRLFDEIGIDVGVKVAKIMHNALGERALGAAFPGKMVEKGHLGKKAKKGFYLFDDAGKSVGGNKDLPIASEKKGQRDLDEVEIQMRVFLPMINEAAYILEEGLVKDPSDVDLALILGIGFPPFKGGLLRYADSEGIDRIENGHEEVLRIGESRALFFGPSFTGFGQGKEELSFFEFCKSVLVEDVFGPLAPFHLERPSCFLRFFGIFFVTFFFLVTVNISFYFRPLGCRSPLSL